MQLSGRREKAMGKYYVYEQAYPDDFLDQELAGTIFYVGKGTGNRIDFHEEVGRGMHFDANQQKCAIIREIQVQGKQVVKRKVYETDVEQDAYLYEWILIHLIYGAENLTNMVMQPQENVLDVVSIKLVRHVRRKLKVIAALSHESMYAVVERLLDDKYAKTFTRGRIS
jgi:hypothetical protein